MTALVASTNAGVGMGAGRAVLDRGGTALDAVEAVIRVVEDNPDDHTVGYGGFPNMDGVVELDASIMDGTTRRAGAVGALRGYRAAITVARAVMERLPHVLVVGEGAARLAAEIGLPAEDLLTVEAERIWRAQRPAHPFTPVDPEHAAGTVDVLALDAAGNLASGVSTSGWAWKYPGRLGDSPVIGAGNYADTRFGAAACTGWGELAIRAGTARALVAALAAGSSLSDAARAAMIDVVSLSTDGAEPIMSLVALAPGGEHAGFTTRSGATYLHWRAGMDSPDELERAVVPAAGPFGEGK